MNLFWLFFSPEDIEWSAEQSAKAHIDRHVTKMCLEAAQLLYTAIRLLLSDDDATLSDLLKDAPWHTNSKTKELMRGMRAISNPNHPMAKWTRASRANFVATAHMCKFICEEYTKRYKRCHSVKEDADWALQRLDLSRVPFPSISLTVPPACVPDEYKCMDETMTEAERLVQSYRNTYRTEKCKIANYWYCEPPEFMKGVLSLRQCDRNVNNLFLKEAAKARKKRKLEEMEQCGNKKRKRI